MRLPLALSVKDPEADRWRGQPDEPREIGERCARLPAQDDRPPEQMLGYDERGMPSLMVLDISALAALLLDEAEAEFFRAAVEQDATRPACVPIPPTARSRPAPSKRRSGRASG